MPSCGRPWDYASPRLSRCARGCVARIGDTRGLYFFAFRFPLFVLKGQTGSVKARLAKDFFFESAQTLPNVPAGHKCGGMHGHSFKLEIIIEGEVDAETGWVYDHSRISRAVEPLLELLDHKYLNEVPGLENPTIELMAAWFWDRVTPHLPGLAEIIIHETPTARCIYRGE